MPIIAIALLAVSLPTAPPVALHRTARLGRYRVTPVKVEEDSRCPMNARCVWAGRVVVRAVVDNRGHRATRRFTLGEPEPRTGLILDGITPDRVAGAGRPPMRYRFHFSLPNPD